MATITAPETVGGRRASTPEQQGERDAAYFESVYREAKREVAAVPWTDGTPSQALLAWMNAVAPSLIRCGARVVVPGCGIGADAREILRRGYDVTAFDCSRSAIEWARAEDPANADAYVTADLFDLPTRWRHRFDLVVEVNTIQSLPREQCEQTVGALSELMAPHGKLLVIARCDHPNRGENENDLPRPLTIEELLRATSAAGLQPDGEPTVFDDDQQPPVQRIRALFKRAAG